MAVAVYICTLVNQVLKVYTHTFLQNSQIHNGRISYFRIISIFKKLYIRRFPELFVIAVPIIFVMNVKKNLSK